MIAARAAMSTAQVSHLGSLLRRYRQQAGLTQEALAERAALSVRGIQDLERGISRTPRQGTVDLLATALGLPPEDRAKLTAAAGKQKKQPEGALHPKRLARTSLIPLVGRTRELAELEHFLADARDDPVSAPFLVFAGEPGMGKTRLLESAGQMAVRQGWRVLVGGCHRRRGQEPYAPILDALTRHLQVLARDQFSSELAGCGWLVRLLPELTGLLEPLPPGAVPVYQERRLMFAAVHHLLANAAGPAGTLLLLDDLQWAGADALDLLATLLQLGQAESGTGAVLRVVGAYRDTEVGPTDPFGLLLADLAQSGLVEQHDLGPLDQSEAEALLTHLLIDVQGEQSTTLQTVLEQADGTPFFLVSYAQAMRLGNQERVPWSLTQGIRQRIAQVPQAREVLGAAAVIGRQVPQGLLLAVVGQPEEEMLEALEITCGARLLLEKGEDAYVFAHDLIREVVESDLGAARRAILHRRVAEALERQPGGAQAELLAYHYGHSLLHDKAVEYLERAGDQARAQFAYDSAERQYRELVERLQKLGLERNLPPVWEKLGEMLHRAGRYTEALPVLEWARDAYRGNGDLEAEVRATASIATTHADGGAPETGIAGIRALLARLEGSATFPAFGSLYAKLGQLLFLTGQYVESLTVNEQAAELARSNGDDRAQLLADSSRMHVLVKLGRMEEALGLTQRILHRTEDLEDPHLVALTHRDLAFNLAAQGAFAIARTHIERACTIARQAKVPQELIIATAIRGWLAFLRGDWRGARLDLEQAVTLSRGGDRSRYAPYPLLFLAHLCLAEGDWRVASEAGHRALALGSQSGDLQAIRWTARVMAELDIKEGRPNVAVERLHPLLDRPGLLEADVTDFLPVLGWAYLQAGQIDQAKRVIEQAILRARGMNAWPNLAEALLVQTRIAVRDRDWQTAARSMAEGLDLAQTMSYPYAEARLLQQEGERLVTQGESKSARDRLARALAVFRQLGARREGEQIEHDIDALDRAIDASSHKSESCVHG